MRKIIPLTLMALLALTACSPAGDSASEQPVADVEGDLLVDPAAEAELLNWRDLLPEGELEMLLALEEGTAPPTLMSQFQRVETDLADAAYAMAVRSVRPYDG